jgi:hypothetical protein
MGKTTHGLAKRGKESRTYTIWKHFRQRCTNPNDKAYSHYGGRGISVCPEWNCYKTFLADMGECPEGLEIDRIDNNGNYEPDNCRWASRYTQVNNRRNCRTFEHQGKTLTAKQWAVEMGVSYGTLIDRLNRGWSISKALEKESPAKLSHKEKATILTLWEKGFKKNEIRDKTGIDYDRVKYVIKSIPV